MSTDQLAVVHADDALLVFDKPSGQLSVPGRGAGKADCLAARAQARWPDALVVHRLDMATSGLIAMARGLPAQRTLSEAFATRRVHKRYRALVQGVVAAEPGAWQEIDLPLIADWPNRPLQKVDFDAGKPSCTRWRLLAADTARRRSLLELEPVTGRSHQLRVHLLAIGHPILGDALYGDAAARSAAARLCLHATVLGLPHPAGGAALAFTSPAPFGPYTPQ
ncbi:RluA family pseudouridine synthase [Xylophilus sp.]|uniref:RluA family pseudouridine synthase n=1 Tax=Xylophilus sp. TaxID=2653893 RepID=UPI0013BE34B1|nr:RluA family pseudouridine synthase [Xylophilus sp.]KAF1047191.1 MAG: Ribosomal large subunit pseudouridine synthase A [Xylophilus sp.]